MGQWLCLLLLPQPSTQLESLAQGHCVREGEPFGSLHSHLSSPSGCCSTYCLVCQCATEACALATDE